jgi:hypothetical protein
MISAKLCGRFGILSLFIHVRPDQLKPCLKGLFIHSGFTFVKGITAFTI